MLIRVLALLLLFCLQAGMSCADSLSDVGLVVVDRDVPTAVWRVGVLGIRPTITSVVNQSPAEQAGLKSGDIILSVGGKKVEKTAELRALQQISMPMLILRGVERVTLSLEAAQPSTPPAVNDQSVHKVYGKHEEVVKGSIPKTTQETERIRNLQEMAKLGVSVETMLKSGYTQNEILQARRTYGSLYKSQRIDTTPRKPSRSYQSDENVSSGGKEEVWQKCKTGYLGKLENPSSARFEDDPMWGVTIQNSGIFRIVSTIYARSNGSMKKFTGRCEGNTSDYSSLRVEVWESLL